MPRHFTYIDWLKCLAIIMVVLRHCSWFNDCFTASLFSICCPLFFIINGALCLQKDYDVATILRRNLHLLFIVAFWGSISTIICMYYRSEPITVKMVISRVCSLDAPYCNYLWFVCSLIVLNFLQPFLRAFIKSHTTKELLILWIIIGLISMQGLNNFLHPISIMSSWNGYSLFYYIGGYMLITDKINVKRLSTWIVLLFAVIGYVLMVLHNWLLTSNDWWYCHFLHNDIFFDSYCTFPCALLSFAIFELFRRLPLKEVRFVTYIANYTFAIYVIHWCLLLPSNQLISSFWLKPIVIFLVSMLIGMLLGKIPYVCRIIQNK